MLWTSIASWCHCRGDEFPAQLRQDAAPPLANVIYSFPPENVIGAVLVGKFAKYLHERAHDLRVIVAPPGADRSLPLEFHRSVSCTLRTPT